MTERSNQSLKHKLTLIILMPAINNWAQAGGFIGGFLSVYIVGFAEQGRENFRVQALTLASIGLTVLCFGIAV